MEILAGIDFAWTIVYVVTAAYFLHRYLSEERDLIHLDLVGLCAGLAVYSFFAHRFHLTTAIEPGALCTRIQTTTAAVSLGFLFDFTMRFAGRRGRLDRLLVRAVWLAGGAIALGIALGFAYDHARPLIKHVEVLGLSLVYAEYAPTWFGALFLVYAVTVAVVSGLIVARAALRDRVNALPVAIGTVLFVVTIVNDALVNAGWVSMMYLAEHGFLCLVFGFVYTLLDRSARLAGDLAARQRELETTNRELETVHADLRRSYDSLSRTQQELHRAERLADLGRMAASLAHEIRNPLCVLSNAAAGLRRHLEHGDVPDDQRTMIAAVFDEVSRLDRLVDDLLAFARPDRRSFVPASLAMVADQAILAVLSGLPDPASYEIVRDYESPSPRATVDIDRMRRALVNLLLNACQATPGGGTVAVFLARVPGDGTVRVGVRDRGEGIAPESRPRLFTPFFSTKPSGTGLGLPIVRSIAEEHGGRVEFESDPGRGSAFWLELREAPAGEPARAPAGP